ncbi:MAG: AAA family ATPase [Prevotella sp.]|nr:AAA family ATPase [Prevotella sp.]
MNSLLALQQQRLLLELEYTTEREAYRRQTEAMGLMRKVKRGDAWYPVRGGRSYYNSLNQLVVEVHRTQDEDIEHNFEYGRPICFFHVGDDGKGGEKISYFKQTGTVNYVDGDRMVVIVSDSATAAEVQNANNLGVQLYFDETTYRLMFEALDRVTNAKGNRLAYLRDLFYSHQQAAHFSFAPLRFPWLNTTQEKAVNEVLRAKDVMVVHGPPGTGKTTTLVEAINETLHRESQVMVCAQSNMAVDWIAEQLTDRGINVLRIGNPTRVNDKMLSFTYERRFEAHPDYPQLWSIRKAIRELRQQRRRGDNFHQKKDRLQARATELELRIQAQLFGEARVIACTLAGSANRILDGQKYATLFIDEAAQALEAACWIAIRKATRVVFAGDHCQLPPTVKSIAAIKGGLAKTLMERIVENKPEVVTLLRVQYRMHEDIMRFSSDYFYGGMVETAPQVKHRSILEYDNPMMWVDTAGLDCKEEFVGETFGRINKAEANLTLETLTLYLKKIGKERILEERIDVGVISPYRAQVQHLRRLIAKSGDLKPFRHLISVNTVDGFQGQERDIIIISLVRANEEGQIGFLKDLRRMNVAITRARMKLIILGDSGTLTRHPFYKRLYNHVMSEVAQTQFS